MKNKSSTLDRTKYESVNARPTKLFFISMLTRDLDVEDAILDFVDNCIDGILRSKLSKEQSERPYSGFWAKISITSDMFMIEDNCGGIPWSEHDRAFRMGRPTSNSTMIDPDLPSVGVYGIGMKRAIFKIGSEAYIQTKNGSNYYEVVITPQWMNSEEEWDLEVKAVTTQREQDGTSITISNLHSDVKERFRAESFVNSLLKRIANHYTVIINKGFLIEVNGLAAKPDPITFRFAEGGEDGAIRPYIFRTRENGVDVFVAVGLREPIPGIESVLEEQEGVRFSSEYAGWTVICNDRVVLYCDRSELTGWGTGGVPRYHTQFIAISGVVEFRGNPLMLPTTTTKRGLNAGSVLYQRVLDRMREGLGLFTNFTNRWKTREEEARVTVSPVPTLTFSQLKQEVTGDSFANSYTKTRAGMAGEQYKPKLPMPPSDTTDAHISYIRNQGDVDILAEALIDDLEGMRERDVSRRVGEITFDLALSNIRKKK